MRKFNHRLSVAVCGAALLIGTATVGTFYPGSVTGFAAVAAPSTATAGSTGVVGGGNGNWFTGDAAEAFKLENVYGVAPAGVTIDPEAPIIVTSRPSGGTGTSAEVSTVDAAVAKANERIAAGDSVNITYATTDGKYHALEYIPDPSAVTTPYTGTQVSNKFYTVQNSENSSTITLTRAQLGLTTNVGLYGKVLLADGAPHVIGGVMTSGSGGPDETITLTMNSYDGPAWRTVQLKIDSPTGISGEVEYVTLLIGNTPVPEIEIPANGVQPKSTVGSGGVNTCGGADACVKEIGNDATVSYTFQAQSLMPGSSDGSQWSTGTILYVPDVVKNLNIQVDTVLDLPAALKNLSSGSGPIHPVKTVGKNLRIVPSDQSGDLTIAPENYVMGYAFDATTNTYTFNGTDPIAIDVTNNKKVLPNGITPGYRAYYIPLDNPYTISETSGIASFHVTGSITTELADTYLPIRATNKVFRYVLDVPEPLQNVSPTFDTATNLPEYSLSDASVNAKLATNATSDGLLGSQSCRVTKETSDPTSTIGEDAEKGGLSAAQLYASIFNLARNPAVNYSIAGIGVNEDGCDQSTFHVSVCPEPTPTPTPEPTPVVSETPTPTPDPKVPSVSIVKSINGDDANTAPGVKLVPSKDADVTFVVKNTGDVKLLNVVVEDDVIDPKDIKCPKFVLDPSETMTCTATLTGLKPGTTHKNTAIVTAVGDGNSGSVSDKDDAHAYTDPEPTPTPDPKIPSVSIVKSINEDDANTAPGVKLVPNKDANVTFVVKNTGDVKLTKIVVEDDTIDAHAITCPKAELNPDEMMTCTATLLGLKPGTTHKNTATVVATPVGGPAGSVSDKDDAHAYTDPEPTPTTPSVTPTPTKEPLKESKNNKSPVPVTKVEEVTKVKSGGELSQTLPAATLLGAAGLGLLGTVISRRRNKN